MIQWVVEDFKSVMRCLLIETGELKAVKVTCNWLWFGKCSTMWCTVAKIACITDVWIFIY